MWPVTPQMIGWVILWEYKNYLIFFVLSLPSIIGIWKSMSMRSKLIESNSLSSAFLMMISSAYLPLCASTHISSWFSIPNISNIDRTANLLNDSSSTINIFFLWRRARENYWSSINRFYDCICKVCWEMLAFCSSRR